MSSMGADDLLRSIGELSELSFAIGSSINLEDNCEHFFNHLMSRKNLSGVSVWVSQESKAGIGYERVYAYPMQGGATWLDEEEACGTTPTSGQDIRFFNPDAGDTIPSFIEDQESAALLYFCPNRIGFVVLHSYLWLAQPASQAEQGQLQLLLSKFMRSIQGCLVHRELQKEMLAHDQSRERERDLQYRISRMERLESIAEVIGHTAHDLNNLFSPVISYPSMILEDLPDDIPPSVVEDIQAIETSAQAAVDILRDLLSISRSERRVTESVNLPDVVDSFSKLVSFRDMQNTNPEITFSFDCEEGVPPIDGVRVQCTQALQNLLTNACEEMSNGGRIDTKVFHVEYPEIFSGYEPIPPGEYVVLEVRDTAEGIPHEILDRIFEPYISRKEMGRSGSGLGLAVVYSVVKHVDGFIDIHTELGSGTAFRLHFPVLKTSS